MNLGYVIGGLVTFLVMGTIGSFMISGLMAAMNLSVAHTTSYTLDNYTHQNTAPGTPYTWTVPTGITSLDLTIVGAGGGGGGGNMTTTTDGYGGAQGTAGTVTTATASVSAGTVITIKHGAFGAGGAANVNGSAGTNSSISIGTTLYNALGGTWGLANATTNATHQSASLSTDGWTVNGSGNSQPGTGNNSFAGGILAHGFGAGGGGGALGEAAGRGENGGTRITYAQTTGTTDPMYAAQISLLDTYELGITMCRLIVIISIIVIAWLLLQQAGIVPRMAPGVQWWGEGSVGPMQ